LLRRERRRALIRQPLYEGSKQDGIKNNILLDRAGIVTPGAANDAGRELILQYLDEFFIQYPIE
jgi:hypothetical protein